MNHEIVIEVLPDGLSAYSKTFEGIATNAPNYKELMECIEDVILIKKEYLEEFNKTEELERLNSLDIHYLLDLKQFFEIFNFINKSKLADYIGINPSLMRQYTAKPTYISEERLKLINDGLNDIGKKLIDVELV